MNLNLPKFNNQHLFEQAFTHRSFLNETKVRGSSNERLEFLGDSILSYIVSKFLYSNYPNYNEGILTNLRSLLVNTKSLAEIAKKLNFGNLLKLSKGEHDSKGRENQSILADSYEAFLGALFLDQGLTLAEQFIQNTLLANINDLIEKKTFKDPKSLLQEYTQSKKQGSPIYKVVSENGPAHAKIFMVDVYVGNKLVAHGQGKSKQQAEEIAAKQALEKLKN